MDILFANESEILSLYEASSFDAALQQVRQHCEIAALTRSEKGCVVISKSDMIAVPAALAASLPHVTASFNLIAFLLSLLVTCLLVIGTHGRSTMAQLLVGSLVSPSPLAELTAALDAQRRHVFAYLEALGAPALGRKARIYAEVAGYAATSEAYHMVIPREDGVEISRTMAMALRSAGVRPAQVGYINAHGTSTPYNDKFETLAIRQTFGAHAYKLAVSSTKSMTGHALGAAVGRNAAREPDRRDGLDQDRGLVAFRNESPRSQPHGLAHDVEVAIGDGVE